MATSRWDQLTGSTSGEEYAATLAKKASTGADMHGEASFVAALLEAPARVLDAGCGTGRVGIRLAELGYDVTGVDLDDSMLAVARREAPQLPWITSDLAAYDDPDGYDAIICAGNVIPLLADGALECTVQNLARLARSRAPIVCGFGLDLKHLPRGCELTSEVDFLEACSNAELHLDERFASWDRDDYVPNGGYLVTVHRRLP